MRRDTENDMFRSDFARVGDILGSRERGAGSDIGPRTDATRQNAAPGCHCVHCSMTVWWRMSSRVRVRVVGVCGGLLVCARAARSTDYGTLGRAVLLGIQRLRTLLLPQERMRRVGMRHERRPSMPSEKASPGRAE